MKTNRIINVGDVIRGFKVVRIVPVAELHASLLEMEHEQTGMRLVWLSRAEENMTFAISFETLPWDDTGVFHILEHSVLCGSDRYQVKEPFVELLKNSMNTFLNAMTFPDKTMYPVSSENDKDFVNLMSVYLDAVFNPSIYHKPEIFHQEGWHFDKDENGDYSYKGVVFNEMKGAFADPEELLENAINRGLFPDTAYGFCSGGDPRAIPTLTYEAFLDAHSRFYTPSNAIVYLDGDIDIDEILAIISEDFLRDAVKTERIDYPALQAPVDGGCQVVSYELSSEEKDEDKYILGFAFVIGSYEDREKQIAMNLLTSVLAGNNEAYLPKLILEKGLAEDVLFHVIDGIAQPFARLEVKNCRKEDIEEIKNLINKELNRIADEGIDRDRIEAVIANNEFLMSERDFGSYPQGLILGIQVLEGYLYGGKPEQNLEVGHHFEKFRAEMDNGYFENCLREVLLDNPHRCEVVLEPSYSLGEERRAGEARRVEESVAAWSEAELEAVTDAQEKLEAWQSSVDSKEALESLPHLDICDLPTEPIEIPTLVNNIKTAAGETTLISHPLDTGDVRHVTLYFDMDGLDEETLSASAFMISLLGDLETETYSADDVMLKIDLLTGRWNSSLRIDPKKDSGDINRICMEVSFSALDHKLMEACELTSDILLNTKFTNDAMILDILKQTKQELMQAIIMGGHALANIRVGAMYSEVAAAKDAGNGIAMYDWIKNLESNWDADAINERFCRMLKSLVRSDRMTVSVTASEEFDATELTEYFAKAFAYDGEASEKAPHSISKHIKCTEGIVIPADIAFAVKGGDIAPYGQEFSSGMKLASRIISLAYLWNEVRVKGGAYGAGMKVDRAGLLSCYSYRDPNAARSLDTYSKSAKFLEEYLANEDSDLTGLIVGAVSEASPLMSTRVKGRVADDMYFAGITYEERCEGRKNLLAMTPCKLKEYLECIDGTMNEGGICVVGSEAQIKQIGEVDKLITL